MIILCNFCSFNFSWYSYVWLISHYIRMPWYFKQSSFESCQALMYVHLRSITIWASDCMQPWGLTAHIMWQGIVWILGEKGLEVGLLDPTQFFAELVHIQCTINGHRIIFTWNHLISSVITMVNNLLLVNCLVSDNLCNSAISWLMSVIWYMKLK